MYKVLHFTTGKYLLKAQPQIMLHVMYITVI